MTTGLDLLLAAAATPPPSTDVIFGYTDADLNIYLEPGDTALRGRPASLVELLPNRRFAAIMQGHTLLIMGLIGGPPKLVAGTDYQTPLTAGTDYQTPLTAGTDYQTPLTAGTDYQTPLAPTYVNPWWVSQNSWAVQNNQHVYKMGNLRTLMCHSRSPGTAVTISQTSQAVIANLGNPDIQPPLEVTFAWRATNGYGGSGSYNTAGTIALTCPTSISLPANSVVMYTINFIKP